MHVFTRALRSREHGALLVPVVVDADVYRFDLLDCVCEIEYDPELFASFPRVRVTYGRDVCDAWCVPRDKVSQLEYKPYRIDWLA